jgi:hypothetical protein
MKQIYHKYEKWEDFKFGMWRKESKVYDETEIKKVIEFTGDHIIYGNAMLRVINEWPVSCEHNLTNLSINRKAWIGHAACCIENGWPEYLVRYAWGFLTEDQRNKANNQARIAILKWEEVHEQKLKKNKFTQLKFEWWTSL